jgi:hypothetical protein
MKPRKHGAFLIEVKIVFEISYLCSHQHGFQQACAQVLWKTRAASRPWHRCDIFKWSCIVIGSWRRLVSPIAQLRTQDTGDFPARFGKIGLKQGEILARPMTDRPSGELIEFLIELSRVPIAFLFTSHDPNSLGRKS